MIRRGLDALARAEALGGDAPMRCKPRLQPAMRGRAVRPTPTGPASRRFTIDSAP